MAKKKLMAKYAVTTEVIPLPRQKCVPFEGAISMPTPWPYAICEPLKPAAAVKKVAKKAARKSKKAAKKR